MIKSEKCPIIYLILVMANINIRPIRYLIRNCFMGYRICTYILKNEKHKYVTKQLKSRREKIRVYYA